MKSSFLPTLVQDFQMFLCKHYRFQLIHWNLLLKSQTQPHHMLYLVTIHKLLASEKWELHLQDMTFYLLHSFCAAKSVTKHHLTTFATSLLVWFPEGNPVQIQANFLDSCETFNSIAQSIHANLSVTLKGMAWEVVILKWGFISNQAYLSICSKFALRLFNLFSIP